MVVSMNDTLINPGTFFSLIVPFGSTSMRIDSYLSLYFSKYSRTFFKKLIDDGLIQCNGNLVKKPSFLVKAYDGLNVQFPLEEAAVKSDLALNIPASLVYQHEHFLVINKPPFLSVHAPHKNSKEPSLVDWLVAQFDEIRLVGHHDRPGIVHRLDKNTSGLLLVSRNNYAHELLSNLFKSRLIKKTYCAIVKGHPPQAGTIDFPIARDPFYRTKMSHNYSTGRLATTHYKVLDYFNDAALVELYPVTGRTHQIRVHCAAIGHPLIGDALYGSSSKLISRHALHATALEFSFEGQNFSFTQKLPQDFKDLVDFFRFS